MAVVMSGASQEDAGGNRGIYGPIHFANNRVFWNMILGQLHDRSLHMLGMRVIDRRFDDLLEIPHEVVHFVSPNNEYENPELLGS